MDLPINSGRGNILKLLIKKKLVYNKLFLFKIWLMI